jgi:hypothetical protein
MEIDSLGPIDYMLIEWPDRQPDGKALPLLVDLVDRGIVRLIDIAFLTKEADGAITALELNELGEQFAVFDGAASGVLGDDDLAEAAAALEPGTSAALLVWENRWAAPLAIALRESGAQLVDTGRIPVQALLAALDAAESTA